MYSFWKGSSLYQICTSLQNKKTPFSPTSSYPGSSSAGSSEKHPLQLRLEHPGSSDGRVSDDGELNRQLSEVSVASSSVEGSLNDPALLKSLTKFQRSVVLRPLASPL